MDYQPIRGVFLIYSRIHWYIHELQEFSRSRHTGVSSWKCYKRETKGREKDRKRERYGQKFRTLDRKIDQPQWIWLDGAPWLKLRGLRYSKCLPSSLLPRADSPNPLDWFLLRMFPGLATIHRLLLQFAHNQYICVFVRHYVSPAVYPPWGTFALHQRASSSSLSNNPFWSLHSCLEAMYLHGIATFYN